MLRRSVVGQRVGGVADLALTAEEDQYVARRLAGQLVDGVQDRLGLVAVDRARVVRIVDRAVARSRPGRCGRTPRRSAPACPGVGEVLGEPLRVDRRRGDDHLEVGTAGEQLLEVAEDEVDVQAALVRLVDDERVVPAQLAVALQLGEQDAVGHQLDQRAVADLVGEPDRVPDRLAELGAELLGDPLGDRARGQPARLRVPDHAARRRDRARGRSSGSGSSCRTRSHRRSTTTWWSPDRRRDVVLELTDRQLLGIRDLRYCEPPLLDPLLSLLDPRGDVRQRVLPLPRPPAPPATAPTAAQAAPDRCWPTPRSRAANSARSPDGGADAAGAPALPAGFFGDGAGDGRRRGLWGRTGGGGRTLRFGPGIRHGAPSLVAPPPPLTRISKAPDRLRPKKWR